VASPCRDLSAWQPLDTEFLSDSPIIVLHADCKRQSGGDTIWRDRRQVDLVVIPGSSRTGKISCALKEVSLSFFMYVAAAGAWIQKRASKKPTYFRQDPVDRHAVSPQAALKGQLVSCQSSELSRRRSTIPASDAASRSTTDPARPALGSTSPS
jgi:hypothetical protein